jgi:hypothetical protein
MMFKISAYISFKYLYIILLLFTAIGFSPGGSSPYTSTHNTNRYTILEIHKIYSLSSASLVHGNKETLKKNVFSVFYKPCSTVHQLKITVFWDVM